jgi:hypothetical protein
VEATEAAATKVEVEATEEEAVDSRALLPSLRL